MSDLFSSVVDSLTTASIDARHVKKRVGEVSALDAFAAKRVADGLEALILEVGTTLLEGIVEWPRSRGFEVLAEPLEGGRRGRTRICLQLENERYREVFRALCADICVVLANASQGTEAIHDFHSRLVRWQSFLQKHGVDGLSEKARCGLFGELLILRDALLPRIKVAIVLPAWRGCKKAHQDFQFLNCALEVKTTRAAIPDRISVSNVQQLDGEGMAHMFLTVVHVHENETTGETLPEIVDSLRAALSDDGRGMLDEGLEEVGYSDVHRHLYSRTRYQPINLLYFEIHDEFPRITRDHISDGVKRVRYEISIDACKPFRTEEAAVLQQITDHME